MESDATKLFLVWADGKAWDATIQYLVYIYMW